MFADAHRLVFYNRDIDENPQTRQLQECQTMPDNYKAKNNTEYIRGE